MIDERVDALVRRLDASSRPDPEFAAATADMLRPLVRAARSQDRSRIGRFRRDLRLAIAAGPGPSMRQPVALAGLVVLLLLAAIAAIVISGALNRTVPFGNGPLIVTLHGALRAIDVDTGTSRPIGPSGVTAKHVSRSPDGRLVAYWQAGRDGDELTFIGIDGQGRRPVSEPQTVAWGGCIDTWSPDSRFLATEVNANDPSRIIVADSATGTGRFVTPGGVIAHCPLWSPDGRWIAFAEESQTGPTTLAIIRADGTDLHSVSGDIGGADVAGPSTWSPDGTWIYFTTGGSHGSNWRANVALRTSTQVTHQPGFATAVASSPDGMLISWIVATTSSVGWDLYAGNSDGTKPHRLLQDALNLGWSGDGQSILAFWSPSDYSGGVAVIAPDGSGLRVIVPADQACIDADRICDLGWGQARP